MSGCFYGTWHFHSLMGNGDSLSMVHRTQSIIYRSDSIFFGSFPAIFSHQKVIL